MQRRGIRKEETQKYAWEAGFERRVKRREASDLAENEKKAVHFHTDEN